MKRATLILAALALLSGWPGQAKADLIVNGGFETGDFTGGEKDRHRNASCSQVIGLENQS